MVGTGRAAAMKYTLESRPEKRDIPLSVGLAGSRRYLDRISEAICFSYLKG